MSHGRGGVDDTKPLNFTSASTKKLSPIFQFLGVKRVSPALVGVARFFFFILVILITSALGEKGHEGKKRETSRRLPKLEGVHISSESAGLHSRQSLHAMIG